MNNIYHLEIENCDLLVINKIDLSQQVGSDLNIMDEDTTGRKESFAECDYA